MAVTWSPTKLLTGAAMTGLSNGNLTAYSTSNNTTYMATVGKSSGKWYFEILLSGTATSNTFFGVATLQHSQSTMLVSGSAAISWRGNKDIIAASVVATSESVPAGTIGVAFDVDLRRVWFAADNVWILSGDPANNLNPTTDNKPIYGTIYFPACCANPSMTAHFAEADFTYAPPAGFSALTEPSDWDGVHRGRAQNTLLRADTQYGGAYRITGTVTELGVAGAYRVRLFDRLTARCIRETWSASDGSYSFPYLAYRANGYFTVAYDHGDSPLNAAIADLITPEPMP